LIATPPRTAGKPGIRPGTHMDVSESPERPNLDDVQPVTEQAIRDRHEHGKAPERLNDDNLARRAELERIMAGVDDYDPDEVPPADG
jgi:hypothetical protein